MTKTILVEVKEREIEVYEIGSDNIEDAQRLMRELLVKELNQMGYTDEEIEEADPTDFGIYEDNAFSNLGDINIDYKIVNIEV